MLLHAIGRCYTSYASAAAFSAGGAAAALSLVGGAVAAAASTQRAAAAACEAEKAAEALVAADAASSDAARAAAAAADRTHAPLGGGGLAAAAAEADAGALEAAAEEASARAAAALAEVERANAAKAAAEGAAAVDACAVLWAMCQVAREGRYPRVGRGGGAPRSCMTSPALPSVRSSPRSVRQGHLECARRRSLRGGRVLETGGHSRSPFVRLAGGRCVCGVAPSLRTHTTPSCVMPCVSSSMLVGRVSH